jgi:integrase
MSRRSGIPSYRLHKQSGQGIVTLTDGLGGRKDVLLGKYDTPESRAEYLRVLGEWQATGRRAVHPEAGASLSVNELLLAFLAHAESHYRRPDGTVTAEVVNFKLAFRLVRESYGTTPAATFGPLALKVVRQRMVEADWCRGVVNQRCRRIVRAFKWGVSEELVPESTWRALTTVRGLEQGRTEARETEPVGPVAAAVVDATLPFVRPPVRGMIQLQRLTGCRPGEACVMRACDIDMGGAVWLYRPPHHKTKHRGKTRAIALGPRAQEIVKPFLKLGTQAYLFSPRDSLAALRQEQRRSRKTRVQPSQMNRRKRNPARSPRDKYTTQSYCRAIATACRRAFPPPEPLARAKGESKKAWRARLTEGQRAELQAWYASHSWHPNQLRHSFATEARRRFGLEAAQVSLGHSQANVTQVYAERDQTLAARVAAEIG